MAATLVIGGQKSGKSLYAERLVIECGLAPVYVATGAAGDAEMATRIAAHQKRRGDGWRLVEEPFDLAGVLPQIAREGSIVLVDCLTLWLSNLVGAERPVEREVEGLMAVLGRLAEPVVLVSNEVGSGIVPDNALARRYADHLGVLNQRVASVAERVVLVTAGLPLVLKGVALGAAA